MADETHTLPEGTWNGLRLMILSSKLRRLYSTNLRDGKIEYVCGLSGEFFIFDTLYEYLTEIGFKIEIPEEAKKLIWQICKNSAEIWRIKGRYSTEDKKEYEIRLYKSELVYLYLVQNFNEGKVLNITDGGGGRILLPTEHPETTSLIKNIVQSRTLQLID